MKNQALFSSKDKSKKLKCCLLQFLFGAVRVKVYECTSIFTKDNNLYDFFVSLKVKAFLK